jgi:predicted TIM-barrel fold metal-dependent hydrolase
MYVTFERDLSGLLAREIWGVDNIMWASDYPHLTSTFPNSMEIIDKLFARLSDEEKGKLVHDNVVRLYRLDAAAA